MIKDLDLTLSQNRSLEHEISDLLTRELGKDIDVEVTHVQDEGDAYKAFYSYEDLKTGKERQGSIYFTMSIRSDTIEDFEEKKFTNESRLSEKVFTLPDPGVKKGGAPAEKARAFDKRGTNRSVLHQLGKGKWIGIEFTTEENEDGEEEIQILMMRDDIEPYEGKHPYYGINVVFKRDGTVFGAAASGDPIASRQWSREKRAIVEAAKKALDDPSLPGMYDGMGGKSVKRGKGKLPFDVTDHKLKESVTHITFKEFLLAEAARPKGSKYAAWFKVIKDKS